MRERKMVPSQDSSQAEIWEHYGEDSGYSPYGYDGAMGYPGYDPRVSVFPFFPIIPIPIYPPIFFPPPFFPRRRRFYW